MSNSNNPLNASKPKGLLEIILSFLKSIWKLIFPGQKNRETMVKIVAPTRPKIGSVTVKVPVHPLGPGSDKTVQLTFAPESGQTISKSDWDNFTSIILKMGYDGDDHADHWLVVRENSTDNASFSPSDSNNATEVTTSLLVSSALVDNIRNYSGSTPVRYRYPGAYNSQGGDPSTYNPDNDPNPVYGFISVTITN